MATKVQKNYLKSFKNVKILNDNTKLIMSKLILVKMAKLKTTPADAIELLTIAYQWQLHNLDELMNYFENRFYKIEK